MDLAQLPPVDDEPAGRALPPSNRIEIWSRDNGRLVKFISDLTKVEGAELINVLPFDTHAEAEAVAQQIADFLTLARHMGPDPDGWHTMPSGVPLEQVLSNLLRAAKHATWASRSPAVGLEPEDVDLPRTRLPADLAAIVGDPTPAPVEAPPDLPDVVVALPVGDRPRRSRASRTWTHERDRALVELILTGHTAKQVALDPRMHGISEQAIYAHASEIGMAFRPAPQITVRGLPSSILAVFDKAAAACHKSRDGLVRDWMMKAASDPDRYGLTAI